MSNTPITPTKSQQAAWHLMNAVPALAFLFVWQAKTVAGVLIAAVVAVVLIVIGNRWKSRGAQQAGEERLRVGPITPLPPENGSGFYVLGLIFFALLAVAMLFIEDFRQLTRIGMFLVLLGLTGSFAALINPKLRKPALTLFGLSFLVGGVLVLTDAVAMFQEGDEESTVNGLKATLLGGVLLFGGVAVTWGIIAGQKEDSTILYENGMTSPWGFLPWSILNVELNEVEGEPPLLQATIAFNGWRYQMPVAEEQLNSVRALREEIHSDRE